MSRKLALLVRYVQLVQAVHISFPFLIIDRALGNMSSLTRTVGAGSFGRVALLVKKSPDGQTLDTLALKEADHMWVSREARKGEPNLPIEVAINRDLNTHDAVHISYLRSYKYGKSTKRGRLYLRHYQYGKYNTFPKQSFG
jgi:hypothetical protein